jgi:hypothetical protein
MKTCLAGILAAVVTLALAASANADAVFNVGDFQDGEGGFLSNSGGTTSFGDSHFTYYNNLPVNSFSQTYMANDLPNASIVVQHTGQADLLPGPSNFTTLSAQVSSTVSFTDPGGDGGRTGGLLETTGAFTIAGGDPQSYTVTLTATGQSVAPIFGGLGYVDSVAQFYDSTNGSVTISSVAVAAGDSGTQIYTGKGILQPGVYGYLIGLGDFDDVTSALTGSASIELTLTPANAVPEPGSLALCGLGGLSLAAYGYRRRQRPV